MPNKGSGLRIVSGKDGGDFPATRQLPLADYYRLKAKTKELIEKAGRLDPKIQVSRIKKSQLARYYDVDLLDCFIPIDVVADLEAQIEKPILTDALAELHGLDVVEPARAHDDDFHCHLMGMSKESAEALSAGIQAIADGRVSPAEASDLLDKLDAVMGRIAALKSNLRAIAGA